MDKFNQGLLASLIAGIPMNILDLTSYHLFKFSNLRYLDWGSVMLFGHLPQNSIQLVLGFLSHLIWVGFLGIIFSFLVPVITSKTILVKGAFYGLITGFVISAIPVIFETKYLSTTYTNTQIIHLIGGLIWGIILAEVLRIINENLS